MKRSLLPILSAIFLSSCYLINSVSELYDFEYYLTEINNEGIPVSRTEITGIRNGVAGYSDVAVSPYDSDNGDFLVSIFSLHRDPADTSKYVYASSSSIYNHIYLADSGGTSCNAELLHTLDIYDNHAYYRTDVAKSWAVSSASNEFYNAHLYRSSSWEGDYYQAVSSIYYDESYYSDAENWVPGIVFDQDGKFITIQNRDIADDSPDPVYTDRFYLHLRYPGKVTVSSEWISGTHYPSGDICWILGIDGDILVVLDESWQVLHLNLELISAELKGRGGFFSSAEELKQFLESAYITYDYDLKNIVAIRDYPEKSEIYFFDLTLNLRQKLSIVFDSDIPEYVRYIKSGDARTLILEVR